MKEKEENSYIALLKKTKGEIQQDKLIEINQLKGYSKMTFQ